VRRLGVDVGRDDVRLHLVAGDAAGVRPWVIGFSIANISAAWSPSPSAAQAITDHRAAWVYCPPFSRTPGGYALT
jgi:hypothetical protein